MIAVIFEAWPAAGERDHYLALAAALREEVEGIDGFISIERFQSMADADKLLSLSFWRDEAAVAEWRNRRSHRAVQAKGRAGVFENYRLRIAAVMRDYDGDRRSEAPVDSQEAHLAPGADSSASQRSVTLKLPVSGAT